MSPSVNIYAFHNRNINVLPHWGLPQTPLGMLHNIRCMQQKILNSETHLAPRISVCGPIYVIRFAFGLCRVTDVSSNWVYICGIASLLLRV